MKIYPKQHNKKISESIEDKALSTTEKISKWVALILAFATVYYFFLKILFF